VAESFFGTLKTELIYRHVWATRRHAELAIFEFIAGWYIQHRRHSTLGYCPTELRRRAHSRPGEGPRHASARRGSCLVAIEPGAVAIEPGARVARSVLGVDVGVDPWR
jgi:hypothetical protein